MQKNYIEKLKDAGWISQRGFLRNHAKVAREKKMRHKKVKKLRENIKKQLTKLTSFVPKELSIQDRIQIVRANLNKETFFCSVCGEPRKRIIKSQGFMSTCGKKDSRHKEYVDRQKSLKTKQTNLERYGVEHTSQAPEIKAKTKQTNLERYGVEYALQSPIIKEKGKQTCLEKYGVEHPSQTTTFQEQRKQTCLKTYGVENPFQSLEVQKKIKQTHLDRRGVEHPMQAPEIKIQKKQTFLKNHGLGYNFCVPEICKKMKQTNLERYGVEYYPQTEQFRQKVKYTNLERYGVEHLSRKHLKNLDKLSKEFIEMNFIDENKYVDLNKFRAFIGCGSITCFNYCRQFNVEYKKRQGVSRAEDQLVEFISLLEYNVKIDRNRRDIIGPLELDIYLPDYNLAIEYDGLLWHSSGQGTHSVQNREVASDKHLAKTKLCRTKGIDLIHIFEDEYLKNSEVVEKLIARKLGKIPWPSFYMREVHWPVHHGEPTHLLKIGYRITKTVPPRANYFRLANILAVTKWTPYPTQEEALDNNYRVYHDCGEYVLTH